MKQFINLLYHCLIVILLVGCESNAPIKEISDGKLNGYDYIDLGLSVKWATCNIGATSPEKYGNYYAWGETKPKSTYHWGTYKHCDEYSNNSSVNLTKYNYNSNYGNIDNRITLFYEDDAAHVNLGEGWRLPTDSEVNELRNDCTWEWTVQKGVWGYKITSNKTGYTKKSIFLPAAGYQSFYSIDDIGYSGYYWTNRLSSIAPVSADVLDFKSDNIAFDIALRCYGRTIRPVCP